MIYEVRRNHWYSTEIILYFVCLMLSLILLHLFVQLSTCFHVVDWGIQHQTHLSHRIVSQLAYEHQWAAPSKELCVCHSAIQINPLSNNITTRRWQNWQYSDMKHTNSRKRTHQDSDRSRISTTSSPIHSQLNKLNPPATCHYWVWVSWVKDKFQILLYKWTFNESKAILFYVMLWLTKPKASSKGWKRQTLHSIKFFYNYYIHIEFHPT